MRRMRYGNFAGVKIMALACSEVRREWSVSSRPVGRNGVGISFWWNCTEREDAFGPGASRRWSNSSIRCRSEGHPRRKPTCSPRCFSSSISGRIAGSSFKVSWKKWRPLVWPSAEEPRISQLGSMDWRRSELQRPSAVVAPDSSALGPNGDGTITYRGRIRDIGSSVRDEAGE